MRKAAVMKAEPPAAPPSAAPPVFLSTAELASMFKIKPETAELWRVRGQGPPYIRLGVGPRARVVYDREAVIEWARSHSRISTADPGSGTGATAPAAAAAAQ